MKKDRYRKVRRALRKVKNLVHWAEENLPNRTARRRFLYEGHQMKDLVAKVQEAKRKVV